MRGGRAQPLRGSNDQIRQQKRITAAVNKRHHDQSGSDRIYDYTQAGRNALASLLAQPTVVQALGGDVVINTAQGEPVQSEPVRKAAAELFIPRFGRDGVY